MIRLGGHPKAWLALLMCAALVGCGPSRAELAADLDRFTVPADWHHAGTVTRDGIGCVASYPCPVATSYYVAAGEPAEVYAEAAEMLLEGGFTIEERSQDPCDRPAGLSICSARAAAGDRQVLLQIWSADRQLDDIDIQDRSGPIVTLAIWKRDSA